MADTNIDLKSSERSVIVKLGLDLEWFAEFMWRKIITKFIEYQFNSFNRFSHLISF